MPSTVTIVPGRKEKQKNLVINDYNIQFKFYNFNITIFFRLRTE